MKTHLVAVPMFSLAIAFGAFALSGASHAEGAAPAMAMMCGGCHGADGVSSIATVPTIAGISSFAHADYLYAYRDGARTCTDPKSKGMCASSAKLTDEKIEKLAEYFAGMKFKAAVQDFDADKAAAGAQIHADKCGKCHTDGGSNPDDDASILAGQWMPYLKQSLAQFAAGQREQPGAMKRKFEGLSEADIEALAHYYASQQ